MCILYRMIHIVTYTTLFLRLIAECMGSMTLILITHLLQLNIRNIPLVHLVWALVQYLTITRKSLQRWITPILLQMKIILSFIILW